MRQSAHSKSAITVTALLASGAIAQAAATLNPPCQLPSPNDPPAVQDCKLDACDEYQIRDAFCLTLPPGVKEACLKQSRMEYLADFVLCDGILTHADGDEAGVFTAAVVMLPERVLDRWSWMW